MHERQQPAQEHANYLSSLRVIEGEAYQRQLKQGLQVGRGDDYLGSVFDESGAHSEEVICQVVVHVHLGQGLKFLKRQLDDAVEALGEDGQELLVLVEDGDHDLDYVDV